MSLAKIDSQNCNICHIRFFTKMMFQIHYENAHEHQLILQQQQKRQQQLKQLEEYQKQRQQQLQQLQCLVKEITYQQGLEQTPPVGKLQNSEYFHFEYNGPHPHRRTPWSSRNILHSEDLSQKRLKTAY